MTSSSPGRPSGRPQLRRRDAACRRPQPRPECRRHRGPRHRGRRGRGPGGCDSGQPARPPRGDDRPRRSGWGMEHREPGDATWRARLAPWPRPPNMPLEWPTAKPCRIRRQICYQSFASTAFLRAPTSGVTFCPPSPTPGRAAYAPDLHGFGDSEPDRPGTWEHHMESLEAFRREIGLERVVLVVHDWGGLIGLRWACDQPRRRERAGDRQHRFLPRRRVARPRQGAADGGPGRDADRQLLARGARGGAERPWNQIRQGRPRGVLEGVHKRGPASHRSWIYIAPATSQSSSHTAGALPSSVSRP